MAKEMEGEWLAQTLETESQTHLEDDEGTGDAAIIRMFEFKVNPEAFKQITPTEQELFASHERGIAALLWRDGMTPLDTVTPRITFSKNKKTYRIFIGAKPAKGHLLQERPKTLSQIAKNK